MSKLENARVPEVEGARERRMVALSLVAVYLIWGSTYLGMRIALQSFPPFLLGGVRFLLAGGTLYVVQRRRGVPAPTWTQWQRALGIGTLLFGLGNGLVAFAQQRSISTGVAAIVIATVPLWSVLFAAFWGGRPRPSELVGLALGMTGVFLLQRGGAFGADLVGLGALLIAPMGWSLGSVLSAHAALPRGAMGSAAQMLGGGLAMLLCGLASGEQLRPVTVPAVLGFVYLVTFGSLIGFSAYQYLLAHTRPALATSYAFVNPAIALLLGAIFAAEPLDAARLSACALTALAVVFVLRARLAPIERTAAAIERVER